MSPVSLPWPTVTTDESDEFQRRVQQNFDALRSKVAARPEQRGTGTIGAGDGDDFKTATITFPSEFASVPSVVCTVRGSAADDTFAVTLRGDPTTTGFSVNVKRVDSAVNWAQDLKLDWIAWI